MPPLHDRPARCLGASTRRGEGLARPVTRGNDPTAAREEDRRALTVKQLCEQYIEDMGAGLIMGKGGRPKKASTIEIDVGRIRRHIIPLLGTRRLDHGLLLPLGQ